MSGAGEGLRRTRGDEDFSGLRAYVPGDSPRQVSWRHAARTGQLLTRETDAPAGTVLALDWADTADLREYEARVSRLAAWVGAARRLGTPFALILPGVTLSAAAGEGQARAALAALALQPPLPAPPAPEKKSRPTQPLSAGPLRFTLFALAVALGPAALRQPIWVTLIVAALLGYTAVRTLRRLPAIPTLLLGLLAGVGIVGLNAGYGTLVGRDAGTAFLVLLVALKAAETRAVRDARLLALLGLFVTLTHFFFSQGPLAAAHAVLSVLLLLAALGVWTGGGEAGHPLRTSARLALQAAPLAALLFVLFPRPNGPLWQLPIQDRAQTGLADQVTAGDYANLAQNSSVAFRADFTGRLPKPNERYWRGPVYEGYDGVRWTQVRVGSPSPTADPFGPSLSYTLTLEPSGKPWLLALDLPTAVPPNAFVTNAFQAVTSRPATSRTRYNLQSRAARLGVQENTQRLQFDIQLPRGESPRALALAQAWRSLQPAARVEAGLRLLRAGNFRYTLSPPALPERNRIDAFLFGTRQGFCEHFASAFTFLMRAAGLPARMVGGYLGGEVNPDGGYLIVRQQDAHTWTEVWLPGQGWVRVDPTAEVAPARVNAGLGTALTQPRAAAPPPTTPLRRAALRFDALQTRWNTWVAGYDGSQQRALLTRAGIGQVGGTTYLTVAAVLLALALLPAFALARLRPRPADPASRALDDLTRRLRLPREPGETPSTYAARAALHAPEQAEAVLEAVRVYHEARYAEDGDGKALRELQGVVRRIRPKAKG